VALLTVSDVEEKCELGLEGLHYFLEGDPVPHLKVVLARETSNHCVVNGGGARVDLHSSCALYNM